MADILERLRRGEHWPQTAAEEISRLRTQNAELMAVLLYIAWAQKEGDEPHLIARAAMSELIKESDKFIFEAPEAEQ